MSANENLLSESQEDYLETILALETENKVARVKDIAERLGVLRGSVSGALKGLGEKGLIDYEPYSFITLTPEGKKRAEEITRRHSVIRDFLEGVLLLSPERAESNACRMEHAVDKAVVDRMVKFIEYIHECPRTGPDWIDAFINFYSRQNPEPDQCRACAERCMARLQQMKKS